MRLRSSAKESGSAAVNELESGHCGNSAAPASTAPAQLSVNALPPTPKDDTLASGSSLHLDNICKSTAVGTSGPPDAKGRKRKNDEDTGPNQKRHREHVPDGFERYTEYAAAHSQPNTFCSRCITRFGAGEGRFPQLLQINHARDAACTRFFLDAKTVLGMFLFDL